MAEVWDFKNRVQRDEKGAYRWTYDLRANGNDAPLWTMIRICLAVTVPIVVIMTVLTFPYGPGQALLLAAFLLFMMVGLPALIWKLAPPNPSFKMTDEYIEAWPKGRGTNIHTYGGVKRVVMHRGIDCIVLRWTVTGLYVYVPREDYEMVREFILAHVPEGAEKLYD